MYQWDKYDENTQKLRCNSELREDDWRKMPLRSLNSVLQTTTSR